MSSEENQNTEEIVIEENIVPIEPKRDVVENIPIVEETSIVDIVAGEQVAPIEEIETPKVVETTTEISQAEPIPPIAEVEPSVVETVEDKQPQSIQPQPQIQTKIIYQTPPNFIQNLLNKARAKIQERKRKKLNKIISLFETKSQITNSDIQKLLRVSRATAKRYMDILENENKVTQIGNVGKGVFYSKKQ